MRGLSVLRSSEFIVRYSLFELVQSDKNTHSHHITRFQIFLLSDTGLYGQQVGGQTGIEPDSSVPVGAADSGACL